MLLTDDDTNKVYFSAHIQNLKIHTTLFQKLDNHQIEYELLTNTKDYWIRDFMPIQISSTEFVQYQYQPDYLKKYPQYITDSKQCLKSLEIEPKYLNVIIDGGNIIKCDDRIIMTDKVFKENRNFSKQKLIDHLEYFFQAEISFIPWDKTEKYGHADGMVRYIGDRKILLNNYVDFDPSLRDKIVNILKPHFEIIELHYPIQYPSTRNWAYINFLQIKHLILLPALHIAEDNLALKQIQQAYPLHIVEQIEASEIIKWGGGLHCISWNIKHHS